MTEEGETTLSVKTDGKEGNQDKHCAEKGDYHFKYEGGKLVWRS